MMALPLALRIYQRLTPLMKRAVLAYVRHRIKIGKEDPHRFNERFGKASVNRPSGLVIWFHAASVGESMSLLPLLQRITAEFPHVTPLVTTGTVTAANVISNSLPKSCIHQYSPIDLPEWIQSFLNHWQPDIAVLVESEFWPNLILECHERKIPLYLINAVMSENSYRSWRRLPSVIQTLLSCFESILAQSETIAKRFVNLKADPAKIQVCGNLKFSAKPLDCDMGELKLLQQELKDRDLWVAASTHAGEEVLVSEAHQSISEHLPNLLTIIIPRHPSRGKEIVRELRDVGLEVAQRSKGDKIKKSTDIYLVDTMGELGLFYRLCDVAFIGGTFTPIGGHNPIEAVLLESAVIWGPHTHKQTEICEVLKPAACQVNTQEELVETTLTLLKDGKLRTENITLGNKLVADQAHVLDYTIDIFRENLQAHNTSKKATRHF
jgi:3-deoxy-D-manno-octulosonic-acid transferase